MIKAEITLEERGSVRLQLDGNNEQDGVSLHELGSRLTKNVYAAPLFATWLKSTNEDGITKQAVIRISRPLPSRKSYVLLYAGKKYEFESLNHAEAKEQAENLLDRIHPMVSLQAKLRRAEFFENISLTS